MSLFVNALKGGMQAGSTAVGETFESLKEDTSKGLQFATSATNDAIENSIETVGRELTEKVIDTSTLGRPSPERSPGTGETVSEPSDAQEVQRLNSAATLAKNTKANGVASAQTLDLDRIWSSSNNGSYAGGSFNGSENGSDNGSTLTETASLKTRESIKASESIPEVLDPLQSAEGAVQTAKRNLFHAAAIAQRGTENLIATKSQADLEAARAKAKADAARELEAATAKRSAELASAKAKAKAEEAAKAKKEAEEARAKVRSAEAKAEAEWVASIHPLPGGAHV